MSEVSYVTIKGSKLSFGYPRNELCENLNADMVDGFHASLITTPNTIIPINQDGILDLSQTFAKINGLTFRRVNLTNATEDYELQVGEEAIIEFEDATSVPLHIATFDGTYYQMNLIPSNLGGNSGSKKSPIFLNPNNTIYSKMFKYAQVWKSSSTFSSSYITYSAFRIGWGFSLIRCSILNRTVYKNIKGMYDSYGGSTNYPCVDIFSTDWRDTTTPWTSLGTITFPQNSSGRIIIKRFF